jgi:sulfite reductase (NADPH) hemoprotein beta-component
MSVQIVTANRLRDGAVVYLTAGKSWSEDFAESLALRDEAAAQAALEAAGADVKARLIVGPYLAEAEETPEGLKPNSARERIRASRLPTITPDVGSWTGRIASSQAAE